MDAGKRDKRVTIQQRPEADTVDAANAPVDGPWTTLARVYMSKEDTALGHEEFRAGQVSARFDTEWEMPYIASMDPDRVDVPKLRRLSYLDRIYDITEAVLGQRAGGRVITLRTLAASTL